MNIERAIGSDHAGYELKSLIKEFLQDQEYLVIDVGPHFDVAVDYPDYAAKVADHAQRDNVFGILICKTGIGMSIAANRYKGIRAALCRTVSDVMAARQHNDANILVLASDPGQDFVQMISIFLNTEFEGGRHTKRLRKLDELGN